MKDTTVEVVLHVPYSLATLWLWIDFDNIGFGTIFIFVIHYVKYNIV